MATIKCDIEELNNITIDQLRLQIDDEGMKNIFTELGFTNLLN
ncbi:hypothetical protein DZC18_003596 [Clostridium beijerinckii]|nr:hypothetical protein [Clostridium beijerinckii]